MIKRKLLDRLQRIEQSFILLGPRQTGKTTLVDSLKPDTSINLTNEQTYLDFLKNPSELNERLATGQYKKIFIDEIQRLPQLLNTIQFILDKDIIESKKEKRKKRLQFFLTGSSARKLKRGGANLLPGRVFTYHLGPLTYEELQSEFRIKDYLEIGGLPGIYTEPDRENQIKLLRSYVATYLREEIQAEALTKNIEGFARFLYIAAAHSGQYLDLSKLSSEAQVPRQTAARYFEILEETLIVSRCDSFAKSMRKRLIQHPKFYFFDIGVLNGALGNFSASQDRKGYLFEHFIFNQCHALAYSHDLEPEVDFRISTFRTEHGAEVDFIIEHKGHITALEIKASSQISRSDLRGFKSFSEYFKKSHQKLIAYLGEQPKKIEEIVILPWKQALEKIFEC